MVAVPNPGSFKWIMWTINWNIVPWPFKPSTCQYARVQIFPVRDQAAGGESHYNIFFGRDLSSCPLIYYVAVSWWRWHSPLPSTHARLRHTLLRGLLRPALPLQILFDPPICRVWFQSEIDQRWPCLNGISMFRSLTRWWHCSEAILKLGSPFTRVGFVWYLIFCDSCVVSQVWVDINS